MLFDVSIFVAGLFAWTVLEYVIHGVLSHSHRTFVTRLHDVHHRSPANVFAIRAWPGTAIVVLTLLYFFGAAPGMIFLLGLLAGFATYEFLHYRIHFASPSCAIEAQLRARHLAHHFRSPDEIFGVTTPLWDIILGSQPDSARMRELSDAGARIPPLSGRSNFGQLVELARSRIAAS
jgi:sterol desaturase/sphingolipid hydroxylase (fatty acid hydroxylase superfamily)